MKRDIKETKELLAFITCFAVASMSAYKNDGKITLGDWKEFIEPSKKLMPAVKGATVIFDELKDIDNEEIKELVEVVKNESGGVFTRIDDLRNVLAIFQNIYALYERNF